jgi:preprotein translocase subunit SecG
MLRTILTFLQVVSAVGIVGLVLLQRGKGADAGAGFGAGASGTVFGARGASTGLSRMTAIFAAIFMLNSLALTYMFQQEARARPPSLLDKVQQTQTLPAPAPAPTAPPANENTVPAVPSEPAQPGPEKP